MCRLYAEQIADHLIANPTGSSHELKQITFDSRSKRTCSTETDTFQLASVRIGQQCRRKQNYRRSCVFMRLLAFVLPFRSDPFHC